MALAEGVGSKWALGLNGRGYMLSTLDQESPFEYRAFTQQAVTLRLPRIDTGPEPGEASLGDLWARSQNDWYMGMGQDVFDGENSDRSMVEHIRGYNPFIDGKLREVSVDVVQGGSSYFLIAHGDYMYGLGYNTLRRFKEDETYETHTIAHPFSSTSDNYANRHHFTADDRYLYYNAGASGIYRCLLDEAWGLWTTAEAKINNLTDTSVLEFGKGRLIACKGNSVHVIDDLTALTSGATAHYTHMDTSWVWSDAQESGVGFYLTGYSDSVSKLYLMTFNASDASAGLTIGIPREIWRASSGEKILTIHGYAGSAFLIGTNRGVRNAIVVDQDGNVVVGPLIETKGIGVGAITTWNNLAFFHYGFVDNASSLSLAIAVMDLSTFAYAIIVAYSGTLSQLNGNSIAMPPWAKEGDGPWYMSAGSIYNTSAGAGNRHILKTGDITFGTLVEKEFRSIEVSVEPTKTYFIPATGTFPDLVTLAVPPTDYVSQIKAKIRLADWTPSSVTTLFVQGDDTTYRWRVRLTADSKLVLDWIDTTGTPRTATSVDPLPSTLDDESVVWIRVSHGYSIQFEFWDSGSNNWEFPTPVEWESLGSTVSMGGTYEFSISEPYVSLPIVLFPVAANSTFLYNFQMYKETEELIPESRLVDLTAYEYAPDGEGNTWVLDPDGSRISMGGLLYLFYSIDGKSRQRLAQSYAYWPDNVRTPTWSWEFPEDTKGRKINLWFQMSNDILSWRLLAEPVPTPRYFRYYVPIQLYDSMVLLDGSRIERKGYAWEYLNHLETIFRAGSIIDLQKPSGFHEPLVTTRVRIEEMEFKEFAPPAGCGGFGGIVLLVLKEVATN